MDHQRRELDVWEEVVKMAGDPETKTNLQSHFYVKEIMSRCPKDYCLLVKKDKEDTYWEPHNEASKDKDKAKSHNSFASANQSQTQAYKKDKHSHWGGHLATGVNATEVAEKDKDKASKDLSHVKCYTYHQKGYYANKCPEKSKN